jgi:2-polyprenyl-3-methyl-5-hydroxy-6-metoxy-1,4-benzoquinol methylase
MALANSFLTEEELKLAHEPAYPLDVYFCDKCGLVQIGYAVPPDALFKDYIYFSATSDLVHRHADYLAQSFQKRFGLNEQSQVVEIASNDGTVLNYFKKTGVKVLGVEPAVNIAKVAVEAGIDTCNDFFDETTATVIKEKYGAADVILGRHVFAHVPEILGFVKGLKHLLASGGAVAIEAPYLIDFVEKNEFDTVYHEHYSYLSVRAMSHLFNLYDMELFDVERVAIHGGSIIYFIGHKGAHPVNRNVTDLAGVEIEKGLDKKETYIELAKRTLIIRENLLNLLHELKATGKRIAAYGAPAKGNTLLNYCGITTDLVEYTVDKSPYKQNLYTPGSHLPVYHPDKLTQDMPDYVLLLAWNFADEILEQQKTYRDKGGTFILPIPEVRIVA